MKRRWIAVARPRNWRAAVVSWGSLLVWANIVLLILLIDIPAQTFAGVWVDPMWIRLALVCVVYLLGQALIPLTLGFLSSAPMLWGKRIRVQVRGRRFRIHLREIQEVELELRPRGEIAVLVLHSGIRLDLCPLSWHGAALLVASVRAAVARFQGRRASPKPKRKVDE